MPTNPARRLRPVPDQPGRAVLYVRVSALMGRGGGDFHSPGMQVEAMRRAIGFAGLREVDVVEDIDRSGQTFTREGIDKIRAMVRAGQVDVVALYDLSRLGRNLAESLTFIRWLREHGVTVMSSQEKIDDSPEGQFMLGQFLGLAQLYGAQIGRRWAQIAERRARAGKHHGVVPAGYRRVDGRLEVDPVLGPAVTAVFTAYAAGGLVSDIQKAYAAARGRPVRRNVIKWMLASRAYLGRVVLRSAVTGGQLDLPGEHEPLVKEKTWLACQRRLARDRTTPTRHLEPAHTLSGLVWCAHCDGAMQTWYSTSNGREKRMVCSRARQIGDCVGPGSPLAADLEAAILAELRGWAAKLVGDPAAAARQVARAARAEVDAEHLQRELGKTREAMGRIAERWARGGMADAAYDKAMASLESAEAGLVEQLERAQQVADNPDPARIVALVADLMRMWPELTGPERNRGLRTLLVKVRIRRADRWREPVADRLEGWETV